MRGSTSAKSRSPVGSGSQDLKVPEFRWLRARQLPTRSGGYTRRAVIFGSASAESGNARSLITLGSLHPQNLSAANTIGGRPPSATAIRFGSTDLLAPNDCARSPPVNLSQGEIPLGQSLRSPCPM